MSVSKNNSESAKNSTDEYNPNELKTKISDIQFELKACYLMLEKKQPYVELIAIHNRLASLHSRLQFKHLTLRDLYNSKLSK